MQYMIAIDQVKSLEWGLNLNQAVLFSYVHGLTKWGKAERINGKKWFGLSKKTLFKEMPLLSDKPDTIKRWLKQLEEKGLVRRHSTFTHSYIQVTAKGLLWNHKVSVHRLDGTEKEALEDGIGIPTNTGSESPLVGTFIPPSRDEHPTISVNPVSDNPIHKTYSPVGTEPQSEPKKNESRELAKKIIDILNDLTSSKFRHSKASLSPVEARLGDGFTYQEIVLVIQHKVTQWLNDPERSEYLRPSTLFRPNNFESYLQAASRWNNNGRQINAPNTNSQRTFSEQVSSTVERNSQRGAEIEARLMREIAELEAEEDSGGGYSVVDENGRVLRSGVG